MPDSNQTLEETIEQSDVHPEAKEYLLNYLEENGVTEEFRELVEKVFTLEEELAGLQAEAAEETAEIYEEAAQNLEAEGAKAFDELEAAMANATEELDHLENQAHQLNEELDTEQAEQISSELQNS